MESPYPFETISIDRISESTLSLHQDVSTPPCNSLVASIRDFGLFRPPTVQRTAAGFELVCGRTRLEVYRRFFNDKLIVCKVIPPSVSFSELLRIVVEDQRLTGPLSSIMTARLLSMCENELARPEVEKLLSEAGTNPSKAKRLLPLLSLEPELRNGVYTGVLSDKTGLACLSMSSEDRIFLCELIRQLGLNANKQKQIIELSLIITAMQPQPIKEMLIMNFGELLDFKEHDNIPQKSATLLRKLYELSHPFSSRAENDFNQRLKTLKLPKNITVQHSPSFERDNIILEIKLENLDLLEDKLLELKVLFP